MLPTTVLQLIYRLFNTTLVPPSQRSLICWMISPPNALSCLNTSVQFCLFDLLLSLSRYVYRWKEVRAVSLKYICIYYILFLSAITIICRCSPRCAKRNIPRSKLKLKIIESVENKSFCYDLFGWSTSAKKASWKWMYSSQT